MMMMTTYLPCPIPSSRARLECAQYLIITNLLEPSFLEIYTWPRETRKGGGLAFVYLHH